MLQLELSFSEYCLPINFLFFVGKLSTLPTKFVFEVISEFRLTIMSVTIIYVVSASLPKLYIGKYPYNFLLTLYPCLVDIFLFSLS